MDEGERGVAKLVLVLEKWDVERDVGWVVGLVVGWELGWELWRNWALLSVDRLSTAASCRSKNQPSGQNGKACLGDHFGGHRQPKTALV
jgi:hypothetical protein